MEDSEHQQAPPAASARPAQSRPTRLWAVVVLVALFLVAALTGTYLLIVRGPLDAAERGYDLARTAGRDIAAWLQLRPEVKERGVVVFYPPEERATWTAQEVSFLVRHTFEHSWLLSQKRFSVEATARAGIGFDFDRPWQARFDEAGGVAEFTWPEPELLFLELGEFRVLQDESGIINRLTPADREAALNELKSIAKEQLDMEDLGQRARQSLARRLDETLAPLGLEVVFRPGPDSTPKP
jgi:hypothetical protein